jgi:3-oxoacyl-[acyl-carrier-protein] synthase-3
LGRYKNAIVGYSQLSSAYIRSDFYNQDQIKKEHILLRWFLSDSACAVVLRANDSLSSGIKLKEVYNESLGGKEKLGMWMNIGAKNFDLLKSYKEGLHHLGQDYNAVVNKLGEPIFIKGFNRMLKQCEINPQEIDFIIATIPSKLLLSKAKEYYFKNLSIPKEKWFSNIATKGYSGGCSIISALDELIEKQYFKPRETLVSITIESSKWMFGGFVLEYL